MPTMPMSATCWPTRRTWTRGEQLRRYTSQPRPIGPPGAKFQYSDTGYVLLGEIIERAAGDSLAAVARREQGFDRLGLATTWWEIAEPAPAGIAPRAPVPGQAGRDRRQRHDGSLWRRRTGHVGARSGALDRRSVRRPRLRTPRHAGRDAGARRPRGRRWLRLGLFAKRIGGAEVYFHLGYWGTAATTARRCGWRWRASPRDARRGRECWP